MADTPSADDHRNQPLTDKDLGLLQLSTVLYYLRETNPDNGLVRDKTDPNAPVSIAAVGMALATIPVVVERGVLYRDFAGKITLKRLRYLLECPQGPEPHASGYRGFFYHFLNIETGRRVWECELSTIDSAFLFAGALTVATYFDRDARDEIEIRDLAFTLYRRADWNWARDGGPTLTHGWRPRTGSSNTAGKATTKVCCCTSSDSVRRRIRCRPRVIEPIAQLINGRTSTAVNCFTRVRSSRINSHICVIAGPQPRQ